jgi:hypothetical protein
MPPPPDAGKGKRKRMRHLATLARLPEAHPRRGPPGGTGLAAAAKSTTRPPLAEPRSGLIVTVARSFGMSSG